MTELAPKMLDATDLRWLLALSIHFHDGRIQTRGRMQVGKSFIAGGTIP